MAAPIGAGAACVDVEASRANGVLGPGTLPINASGWLPAVGASLAPPADGEFVAMHAVKTPARQTAPTLSNLETGRRSKYWLAVTGRRRLKGAPRRPMTRCINAVITSTSEAASLVAARIAGAWSRDWCSVGTRRQAIRRSTWRHSKDRRGSAPSISQGSMRWSHSVRLRRSCLPESVKFAPY